MGPGGYFPLKKETEQIIFSSLLVRKDNLVSVKSPRPESGFGLDKENHFTHFERGKKKVNSDFSSAGKSFPGAPKR